MKSRISPCIAAITLFTVLAVTVRLAAQEPQRDTPNETKHQLRYNVTDLGTLGGTFSVGYGLNDSGSVVGYATLTGDTASHAFL